MSGIFLHVLVASYISLRYPTFCSLVMLLISGHLSHRSLNGQNQLLEMSHPMLDAIQDYAQLWPLLTFVDNHGIPVPVCC